MTAAPRRFLALHLPTFATDRLRRAEPGLPAGRPLATWAQAGSRRLLVAVDRTAAAAGLRAGQALADAQAIRPDLLLRPAAPEAEAALLHALALRGRRYTPLAATDPPDGLLFDVTGCAHLFGGERALLDNAVAWLRAAGIAARGAVAGGGAAAAALARARRDDPVVVSGAEEQVARPLPIGPALRLPEAVLSDLARLGLRRVDDLLRQPRAALARRFGAPLLERLDAVTGRQGVPLRPVLPPPDLRASRALLEPVVTRGGIEAVLDRLLDELCERLRAARLGARRLVLTAERVDGAVQEVTVGTGLPVRAPAHLRRLFAEKLGGLEPDLGFERMALAAWASDPLPMGRQTGFAPGAEAVAEEALAQLLDRLAQRLRVHRVAPLASHWPEHMLAALGPHAEVPRPPPGWPLYPAPVLRLQRPVSLVAKEALKRVQWRGAEWHVLRAEGPLRLAPEWWRSPAGAPERDYHRVELASGERLWLCRAAGGWWLHGHLP
ncbi:DNA polymerase Y family protein [Roseomonas sp. M0104]|uniref:DNA-directed DNA polymerase n=1 Tax=Teichococcus coralli TaxID=2545983 RepID=A0A845BKW3_9PROT|nr:DNA polymerase Y family protein [Pseudoroseomonas coralli]MXP64039.1 DNA polymerase Y family protein [Pseudoroseomonas coralli]